MFDKKQLFQFYEKELLKTPKAIPFIGPRALFDPNFVPPVIVPRIKIVKMINDLLFDALSGGYGTNINLYGLEGSGKNVVLAHYLEWTSKIEMLQILKEHEGEETIAPSSLNWNVIKIDCSKIENEQIFFFLIEKLLKILKRRQSIETYYRLSKARLWQLVKHLISKVEEPLIILLRNSENIEKTLLDKIFALSKTTANLQVLTTLNSGIQHYTFKQYSHIDYRIKLDLFEIPEIFKITKQRTEMVFDFPIEKEPIRFIVDITTDFDMKVPGAPIKFLREAYPTLIETEDLTGEDIRRIGQYYFEGFSLDAMALADYLEDCTIEERLFFEYIINYFQRSDRYYIPFGEIKNAFLMTSEELGFTPKKDEFYKTLRRILNTQILVPTRLHLDSNVKITYGIKEVPHYLTLPVPDVNEILEGTFHI